MKRISLILPALMGMIFLVATSCNKNDDDQNDDPIVNNDPLKDYAKIGVKDMSDPAYQLELYMSENPFVGYNHVAVRLVRKDMEQVVENARIMFRPMMDMGTMMHSAPFEQPEYDAGLKAHMGSATFIMPGGMAGSWSFNVMAGLNTDITDTISFDIDVISKTEARLYSFISAADSNTAYFVALAEPRNPKVGLNDLSLMIYYRENMMSFPAATDLQIEMEPEMPTMGHGSVDNVHPVHQENGRYNGKVNFNMPGYWKINLAIRNGQNEMLDDDGFFNVTF